MILNFKNTRHIEIIKEELRRSKRILNEEVHIWTLVGDTQDQAALKSSVDRLKRHYEHYKLDRIDTSRYLDDLHDLLEVWIKDDADPKDNAEYITNFLGQYPIGKTNSSWRAATTHYVNYLMSVYKLTKAAKEESTDSYGYKVDARNKEKEHPYNLPGQQSSEEMELSRIGKLGREI